MMHLNWYLRLGAPLLALAIGIVGSGGVAYADNADAALQGPGPNCNDARSVLQGVAPPDAPADPEVEALMGRLRSGDQDSYKQASKRLGQIGAGAVPALAKALFDSDPRMRASAASTIGGMEPPPIAVLPTLVCHLRDYDDDVRYAVVSAIGRTRSPAAIAPLMAALRDQERCVSQAAVNALGEFGPAAEPAIPLLVQLLYPQLVLMCGGDVGLDTAAALGKIGPAAIPAVIIAVDEGMPLAPMALSAIGPAGVPPLIEALRHPNRKVRIGAVEALGDSKPPPSAAVPAMTALFEEDDELVRGRTALALSEMGNAAAAAVPALVGRLSDPDEYPRWLAAKALGDIGVASDEVIIGLVNALNDGTENVRTYAIESLGKLHARADIAIPALVEVFVGGLGKERKSAIDAIGDYGADARVAVPTLAPMLANNDSRAVEVAHTLGRIGAGAIAAIPQLVAAVERSNGQVASESLIALALIAKASPETATALRDCALHHQGASARQICAAALGADSAEELSAPLEEALANANPIVRNQAAFLLVQIGRRNDQVVATLIQTLSASDQWWMRSRAAKALGDIGSGQPQVIAALTERLADKHSGVRGSAADALAQIGPPAASALPVLRERLADEDPSARKAAAAAIAAITRDGQQ